MRKVKQGDRVRVVTCLRNSRPPGPPKGEEGEVVEEKKGYSLVSFDSWKNYFETSRFNCPNSCLKVII